MYVHVFAGMCAQVEVDLGSERGREPGKLPPAPALADLRKLPPLPYAPDALEPWIDTETMQIHHDKHHQAYITNLGKVLDKYSDLTSFTLGELQRLIGTSGIPGEVTTAVRNNGYYPRMSYMQCQGWCCYALILLCQDG